MVTDDKFSPVMSLLIVLMVVVMQYHSHITFCFNYWNGYISYIYQNLAMGLD